MFDGSSPRIGSSFSAVLYYPVLSLSEGFVRSLNLGISFPVKPSVYSAPGYGYSIVSSVAFAGLLSSFPKIIS